MMFIRYAAYRLLTMVLTLIVVSMLIFLIINLPPGDYLSNQIAELRATAKPRALPRQSSCAPNTRSTARCGSNT